MQPALLLLQLLALTIHGFIQSTPEFEETLDFQVSTPACRWPADEKDSPYVKWLDSELSHASDARRVRLLATKGYYLCCNHRAGKDDLKAALQASPRDPRTLSFCTVVGGFDVDSAAVQEWARSEPWKSEMAVAQILGASLDHLKLLDTGLDQRNPLVRLLNAYKHCKEQDDEQAEKLLREYLAEYKSGPLCDALLGHVSLAAIFMSRADYEQAMAVIETGLSEHSISPGGWVTYVLCACKTGKEREALKMATLTSRACPHTYHESLAMAFALHANGEHKKAMLYWDRLLAEKELSIVVASSAADSLIRTRSSERAADALVKALECEPDHPSRDLVQFRVAVYRLLDPAYAGGSEAELVDTICGGIVRKLSTASDRLLGVGALINHQKYDLATHALNTIAKEELGPTYNNLKDAVRVALEKREAFRL